MVIKIYMIILVSLCFTVLATAQQNFVEINPTITSTKVLISQISDINNPNKVEIRVFDVFGILLFRHLQPLDEQGKMIPYELNLSKFPAAVYVLEVRQTDRLVKTKVVKRHH
jgi:hypothetical protein